MAFRKLVILVSVFLPIIFAKFTSADLSEESIVSHDQNGAVFQPNSAELELELELHQLNSKIIVSETSTEDQIDKLGKKIEEKSVSLVSLQSAVQSLEEEGSLELKEQIGQVNARVFELEKQEEMLKAKLEGSSTTKKRKQSIFATHWNEIGRPALNLTIKKAIKRKYEVEKWIQPHLEAAKIFTNPYIDRVSEIIKPHVEKADIYINPYSTKIIRYYNMIVTNVEVYHSLVHKTLRVTLNSYEFTKPLAREGLIEYMASIVTALPWIVLSRIVNYYAEKERRRRS
ncbi:hypothetical protein ACP275_10G072300 [Erythranthe tilingii]